MTVTLADDMRHDRKVALKVLNPELVARKLLTILNAMLRDGQAWHHAERAT